MAQPEDVDNGSKMRTTFFNEVNWNKTIYVGRFNFGSIPAFNRLTNIIDSNNKLPIPGQTLHLLC